VVVGTVSATTWDVVGEIASGNDGATEGAGTVRSSESAGELRVSVACAAHDATKRAAANATPLA
jgi:hypothetical protein